MVGTVRSVAVAVDTGADPFAGVERGIIGTEQMNAKTRRFRSRAKSEEQSEERQQQKGDRDGDSEVDEQLHAGVNADGDEHRAENGCAEEQEAGYGNWGARGVDVVARGGANFAPAARPEAG